MDNGKEDVKQNFFFFAQCRNGNNKISIKEGSFTMRIRDTDQLRQRANTEKKVRLKEESGSTEIQMKYH